MEKLSNEQINLIKLILNLSKATFFQCSGLKRFTKNNEFKEKIEQINELEQIFNNNNEFYYKNNKEEV